MERRHGSMGQRGIACRSARAPDIEAASRYDQTFPSSSRGTDMNVGMLFGRESRILATLLLVTAVIGPPGCGNSGSDEKSESQPADAPYAASGGLPTVPMGDQNDAAQNDAAQRTMRPRTMRPRAMRPRAMRPRAMVRGTVPATPVSVQRSVPRNDRPPQNKSRQHKPPAIGAPKNRGSNQNPDASCVPTCLQRS